MKILLIVLVLLLVITTHAAPSTPQEEVAATQQALDTFDGAKDSLTGLEVQLGGVFDAESIFVLINKLDEEAQQLGLTETSIQTRVELRILESKLTPYEYTESSSFPPDGRHLFIDVRVVGTAFHINVFFRRPTAFFVLESVPSGVKLESGRTYDHVSATKYLKEDAVVWHNDGLGTHGGSANYVLSGLDLVLDIFLRDYLSVNQVDSAN
jgi:hypothetical protein